MTYQIDPSKASGDEVVEKKTNKSIRVICAFEEPGVVMIEGTREDGHYDHWSSDQVR